MHLEILDVKVCSLGLMKHFKLEYSYAKYGLAFILPGSVPPDLSIFRNVAARQLA
jgi:hypothetical protein